MPACCFLVAHVPRARFSFSIPVLSLLLGASLTVLLVSQPYQAGRIQPADRKFALTPGPSPLPMPSPLTPLPSDGRGEPGEGRSRIAHHESLHP
jgi:hypothetical protein